MGLQGRGSLQASAPPCPPPAHPSQLLWCVVRCFPRCVLASLLQTRGLVPASPPRLPAPSIWELGRGLQGCPCWPHSLSCPQSLVLSWSPSEEDSCRKVSQGLG